MNTASLLALLALCSCSVVLPWPDDDSGGGSEADDGSADESSGSGMTSTSGGSGEPSAAESSTGPEMCTETQPYEPHYACGDPCLIACADDGVPFCRDGETGPLSMCSHLCDVDADCEPFLPDWPPVCSIFGRCFIPCGDGNTCPEDYECVLQEMGPTDDPQSIWHCMPHAL